MHGAKDNLVILFGKTGDGKSTVANALVKGGIEDAMFKIGHGVKGCTSNLQTFSGRGWTVTDTVGLGEGKDGRVSNESAERMIMDFLKKVKGQYSHVIYVKSSANRFDVLDETIWRTFERIFKGADEAFTILFTKGDQKWFEENWEILPDWVKIKKDNVFITDIPPIISERRMLDKRNRETRKASIEKLEADLLEAFRLRGGRYSTPDISKMSDTDLEHESRSILDYIREIFRKLVQAASDMATVGKAVSVIYAVFAL